MSAYLVKNGAGFVDVVEPYQMQFVESDCPALIFAYLLVAEAQLAADEEEVARQTRLTLMEHLA